MSSSVVLRRERGEVFWVELECVRLMNEIERQLIRVKAGSAWEAEERAGLARIRDALKGKWEELVGRWDRGERGGVMMMAEGDGVAKVKRFEEKVESFLDELGIQGLRSVEEEEESAMWAREAKAARRKGERDSARDERKDLLGEGIRSRKAGQKPDLKVTKEEGERVMAQHRPLQEQLTSELVAMVGQLKTNFLSMNDQLVKDAAILEETDQMVDKNLGGVTKQRKDLGAYSRVSSRRFIYGIVAFVICILVWITVLFFIRASKFM